MTRLWIFLVVALISMHLAEGSRRRPKKYYDGYKRGGMGYPKRSNYGLDLRKVAPRCSYKMTWLQIVVEGPKGGGFPNALISLQDSKQMGKIYTDKNGVAKAVVKGCHLSMIVWGKDLQSTIRQVNLENNKSGKQTIYIKVNSKCNFLLNFDMDNSNGPLADSGDGDTTFDTDNTVQYQYVAKSGGHQVTGNGIAAAGSGNAICINWEPLTGGKTGSLKVKAVHPTSAEISILHITKQNVGAAVNIPPYIEDSYKFLICFNAYPADDPDFVTGIDSLKAYDDDEELDLSSSVEEDGNCAWFKDLDDLTDRENTLLAIQWEEDTGKTLEGNAYILDCNGKFATVELPKENTYEYDQLWPFACLCAGAKDISGVKVLKNQDFEDSIDDFNDRCNSVCH